MESAIAFREFGQGFTFWLHRTFCFRFSHVGDTEFLVFMGGRLPYFSIIIFYAGNLMLVPQPNLPRMNRSSCFLDSTL